MLDFATKPTLVGDRVTLRPVSTDDVPSMRDVLDDDEGTRLTGTHDATVMTILAPEWHRSAGS